jgi:glycerol uptake facilitator protein
MNLFLAEVIGTMVLILLGDGVVANIVLSQNKGEGGGGGGAWIAITAGWGFAVAVAVYIAAWASGAHINPAVTIGLLAIGQIGFGTAITYRQVYRYAGQALFLGDVCKVGICCCSASGTGDPYCG